MALIYRYKLQMYIKKCDDISKHELNNKIILWKENSSKYANIGTPHKYFFFVT